MSIVRFFVEGKRDVRFLTDYIFHLSGQRIGLEDFVKVDGNTIELVSERRPDFQKNTDAGGINLMIFDSNGDFSRKQQEILSWHSTLGIQFELFLFPNNSDTGNLETLLENIALPQHRMIFECFNSYQDCVRHNPDYTLPNQKAKIYAYLEALLPKSKSEQIRDEKRNYLDTALWNLNSDYLRSLRDFLTRHI